MRRIKIVQVAVSSNFYKLLDKTRENFMDCGDSNLFKKKLSFPEFTELIHKNMKFPKLRRRTI